MLLQRKSLALVAPSGEKYLIFMIHKVCKWIVISSAKNYQNSLKRALPRRKKLHWPRLAHPVPVQMWAAVYGTRNSSIDAVGEHYRLNHAIAATLYHS